MDKLKIIIAGPGAGKTYNLKNEVINYLPNLNSNRFCAVITYTNAATEELRQRISTDIQIPPNVFIGTIHSFLIRFVIGPFGHLVGLVPVEKNYIDNVKSNNPQKKNAIQKKLSDRGIITFDKVLQLSKEIIKNRSVKKILINRLQFLFVDEYQDSKKNTHKFFLKIIKDIKRSYFIGDKLQYIYGFTNRNNKDKDLSITPFVDLINKFPNNIEEIIINFRSSKAIVQLINNYIEEKFKQSSKSNDNAIPVYFINDAEPAVIIESYNQLKTQHKIDQIHRINIEKATKSFLKDFYLTSDWIKKDNKRRPKLSSVYDILNGKVLRLEKGNHRINSILQEVSRCILAVVGVKKHDFIESKYDEIEYRKFCFAMGRCLKRRNFNSPEHRINLIRKQFREKFNIIDDSERQVDVEKSLDEFSNNKSIILSHYPESCYSSIHSAKGLESTAVLAIAYSKNELEKWLNFQKANDNLDDNYRLGYVAFSRARDMLCIACLEKISDAIKNELESLNIVFYPNNLENKNFNKLI